MRVERLVMCPFGALKCNAWWSLPMARSDYQHEVQAPARRFLAIHPPMKTPREISSIFNPEESKNDDCYRMPMTRSDYLHELRAP
eukprot:5115006-Pyramimonas_sp.AAC.1